MAKRPRVSRDTRLLFAIVLISVATLWVLARVRYPDRVPTANPVPPVLAQLAPPSAFDDIVSTVAQLEPRVQSSVVAVAVRRPDPARPGPASGTVAALRFRDGVALARIDAGTELPAGAFENGVEVAHDPATDVAVIRVPGGAVPALTAWTPRQFDAPRFLLAADVRPEGTSLRPVFVGSLYSIDSPVWAGPVWAVPGELDVAPGTFLFTLDGLFAGLAVRRADGLAIVPGDAVLAIAERLAAEMPVLPGYLGVSVQAMTPIIAAATAMGAGAAGEPAATAVAGVVVTWVDPQGPAAAQIRTTDVVEALSGEPIPTLEHWQARLSRMRQGESVILAIRTQGSVREVQLTAAAVPPVPANQPLGLLLRTVRQTSAPGAEVVRVDPDSVALRAGIAAGDIITTIGDVRAPTAAQVSRVFAAAPDGALLLVGVTRGNTHYVTALERKR
jgi:hypothetical protein